MSGFCFIGCWRFCPLQFHIYCHFAREKHIKIMTWTWKDFTGKPANSFYCLWMVSFFCFIACWRFCLLQFHIYCHFAREKHIEIMTWKLKCLSAAACTINIPNDLKTNSRTEMIAQELLCVIINHYFLNRTTMWFELSS